MISNTLLIQNEVGLHARPASIFVKTAQNYDASITVSCNGKKANAKSILSILSLGVLKNSEITISVVGDDGQEAMNALQQLVIDKFGEL